MINLRKISEENFIDAFNLKLWHEQDKFVSHPIRSLAQAYVYRDQCQPFGIYDDDIPEYNIWHMMIDEKHQGKGYGKAALEQILAYISTKPFGNLIRVTLTCNKDNKTTLALYRNIGFIETGVVDDDEIELTLDISM